MLPKRPRALKDEGKRKPERERPHQSQDWILLSIRSQSNKTQSSHFNTKTQWTDRWRDIEQKYFWMFFLFLPSKFYSSPIVIPMESYLQTEHSKPAQCEVFLLLTEKRCSFTGGILMAASHFVQCSGNSTLVSPKTWNTENVFIVLVSINTHTHTSAAVVLIRFFQRQTMNFLTKFQIACLFK